MSSIKLTSPSNLNCSSHISLHQSPNQDVFNNNLQPQGGPFLRLWPNHFDIPSFTFLEIQVTPKFVRKKYQVLKYPSRCNMVFNSTSSSSTSFSFFITQYSDPYIDTILILLYRICPLVLTILFFFHIVPCSPTLHLTRHDLKCRIISFSMSPSFDLIHPKYLYLSFQSSTYQLLIRAAIWVISARTRLNKMSSNQARVLKIIWTQYKLEPMWYLTNQLEKQLENSVLLNRAHHMSTLVRTYYVLPCVHQHLVVTSRMERMNKKNYDFHIHNNFDFIHPHLIHFLQTDVAPLVLKAYHAEV